MADFLSNGVSGLLAFKRALDTTAHNIANVGTPGYSRQRVDLQTRAPSLRATYQVRLPCRSPSVTSGSRMASPATSSIVATFVTVTAAGQRSGPA